MRPAIRSLLPLFSIAIVASPCLAQSRPNARWMRGGTSGAPYYRPEWSPDGSILAVPYIDSIGLFRTADGMLVGEMPQNAPPLVSFLPDGTLIVLNSNNPGSGYRYYDTLESYSAGVFALTHTAPVVGSYSPSFNVEPNGQHVIANQILYNAGDMSRSWPNTGCDPCDAIWLRFTPENGTALASLGHGTDWVDLTTQRVIVHWDVFSPFPWIGGISPDLDHFLTASGPTAEVASLSDGSVADIIALDRTVCWWQFSSFSPDGKWITGSGDGVPTYGVWSSTARVWDTQWGVWDAMPSWSKTDIGAGVGVQTHFSPDSRLLAVAPLVSGDSPAHIDNVADGSVNQRLSWRTAVDSIAHSPDGSLLAVCSQNGPVQVWATATGALVREIPQINESPYGIAFTGNSTLVVTHGAHPGNNFVKAYDLLTGAELWRNDFGLYYGSSVIAISTDGTKGALGYGINIIYFDPKTGDQRSSLGVGQDGQGVSLLAWSPDGSALAAQMGANWLGIIDPNGLHVYSTGITSQSIDWSQDGTKLLLAGGYCYLFDVATRTVGPHFGRLPTNQATWSPDGKQIVEYVPNDPANGSRSGLVFLDADTKNELLSYTDGVGLGSSSNHIVALHFGADDETISFGCHDGTVGVINNPFAVPANTPPVATDLPISTLENVAIPGTLTASDADSGPLTFSKAADPANGTAVVNADGSFTYTPNPNFAGTDSFTFKANDGKADSNVATVTITVTSVNQSPSFTMGTDQTAGDGDGAQTVASWATNLSAGPPNESSQTLDFIVTTDHPAYFTTQPSVDGAGTLTYTAALSAKGTATVTVILRDSGGTDNGGVDTSAPQTFTITINDNVKPVINGSLADLNVTATSTAGAVVSFNATATDNVDGTFAATTSPASGSQFPLGMTTVAVNATDSSLNAADGKSFKVNVTYSWSNYLQPINLDGSSVFKLGKTIVVKFQLTGASTGITNAVAHLYYAKVSNGVAGDVNEADSNVGGDSGNFRYDAATGTYLFNWSTKGLTTGTYQLKVDLGDGVQNRVVNIGLK